MSIISRSQLVSFFCHQLVIEQKLNCCTHFGAAKQTYRKTKRLAWRKMTVIGTEKRLDSSRFFNASDNL